MAHEYVFRGEGEPFAPDPKDLRAREEAKREAEQLVNQPPKEAERDLSADAEVEEKIGDYQVGGLDSFGASPPAAPWEHRDR